MTETQPRAAAWIYRGLWSGLVRWFRVPALPPSLPDADDDAHAFQPDHAFLQYLKLLFWIIAILIDIALTVAFLAAAGGLIAAELWWVIVPLIPLYLVVLIVPDVIAYVAVHLRFDTTWYVMNDRAIRIRRGIWIIHETTITFENVQNLRIEQGPLQQYFGIATLILETAGSGSGGGEGEGKSSLGVSNAGIIEGMTNARELRERILPQLRRASHAGLGDDVEGDGAWTPEHLAVLREMRDAVRGLAIE